MDGAVSTRLFLGKNREQYDLACYDVVSESGRELRNLLSGFDPPFKLRLGEDISPREVAEFFDGRWPEAEDLWKVYFHDGSILEHPTIDEILAKLETRP